MTAHIVATDRDVDLVALILRAKIAEGKLAVDIKPYVENRRRRQENLYRKWCRIIAAETGNDPEHIHKYCAKKWLGTECNVVRFSWQGKTVEREVDDIRSTTELTVQDMSHYMTQVREWTASTLGIMLPEGE